MLKQSFLLFLLVLCSITARAETEFGQWSVAIADDKSYVFASTSNDSGAVLGEYCYFASKQCIWIIGTDTSCDKGHIYPVLANSNEGASDITLTCRGEVSKGLFAYAIDNWSDLESLVKSGAVVGFAVPMQQDQFRVYRFRLNGVLAATQKAEATAAAVIKKQDNSSSKVTSSKSSSTETL